MKAEELYRVFMQATTVGIICDFQDLPPVHRHAWDTVAAASENKESKHPYRFLNLLAQSIHTDNHGWWHDLETGKRLDRNVGEMLMLVVSEIAEAMEGHRKDLMDDHLPHRKMIEVELADAMIRILDIAFGLDLDIGRALEEKLAYNRERADHKREARMKQGGKKY